MRRLIAQDTMYVSYIKTFFQNDAVDVTDLRTKKIVTFELENYPEKARNDYRNLVRDICNVVFKQS